MMAAAMPHEAGTGALAFTVRGEALAIAASDVSEIIRVPPCTRVPNGPASLVGIANLRGTVLPIVSMNALLSEPVGSFEPTPQASRVLVLAGTEPVGLLVDAVGALSRKREGRMLDPRTLLARDFGASRRRISGAPAAGIAPVDAPACSRPASLRDRLALIGLMIAGQHYALPMSALTEVMRLPEALPAVPHTGEAMVGVAASRGGLLPVVSLRVLLGLPAGRPGPASRIVVVAFAGLRVGLVVDSITGTLEVPADAVDPVPPVLLRGRGEAHLEGICRLDGGRRLVCLLSPSRLFDEDTTTRIRVHGQELREREAARMPAPDAPASDAPASDAHSPDASEAGSARHQFVVFGLGRERYGVPIEAVDEVVRRPGALTRMPHAPAFVEGMMNLRGKAIPVIATSLRFGAAPQEEHGHRVIVLTIDGIQAGFTMDAVSEVLSVPASELRPAPAFEPALEPAFDPACADGPPALFDRVAIERDGRMILLVSARGVLQQAERDLLAAFSAAAGSGRHARS